MAARVTEFASEPAEVDSRVILPVPTRVSKSGPHLDGDRPIELPSLALSAGVGRSRQIELPSLALSAADERDFWDTPPRYSDTDLELLAPASASPRQPAMGVRVLPAQLLLAAILCTVVVLLALKIKALTENCAAPAIDQRMLATVGEQSTSRP